MPAIPKIENIHSKVFEAASQPRAFKMSTWHTCNTTHCRAGWVVTLAGKAGKELEAFHNTEMAAMLIYRESSPHYVNPSRFYDNETDALNDMRRMSILEKGELKAECRLSQGLGGALGQARNLLREIDRHDNPSMAVHHIDGNPHNNTPANLRLIPIKDRRDPKNYYSGDGKGPSGKIVGVTIGPDRGED